MAYKALYRTYRPQKFDEVYGQEVIVKTLKNAIINNKITHAYLFSGPRGIGKTTIARIFAKALNCKDLINGEPCCKCDSCIEISNNSHPDVIEIDAASNNGVDEIREIREKVKFLPVGSKYKVYIIDEVHMLTTGAFNALLKTLEEPPKHVIFIFATTEPHKIPQTILSRCQCYEFKALTVKEISSQLKAVCANENINITDEALLAISEYSDGGMRDALSTLDQVISYSAGDINIESVNTITGNLNYDKIIDLATFIEKSDVTNALKCLNDLILIGKEESKIVNNLLEFYRDVLLYKSFDESMKQKQIFTKTTFKELAGTLTEDKVFYYVDILSDIQNKIKYSNTAHIYLEISLIKMINASTDSIKLTKRIQEIEKKVSDFSLGNKTIQSTNISSVELMENTRKISVLDEKLSKVITQLGTYDLPKLVDFYKNVSEGNMNISQKDEESIEKMQEDLLILKANYLSLENQKSSQLSEKNINDKIDLLNKKITDISKDLNDELNKQIEKKFSEIEILKKSLYDNKYTSNYDYDIIEIKDKIINIENKLYKYISIISSNEPLPIKKSKNKNQDGVVVLSEGIFSLNKLGMNDNSNKNGQTDIEIEVQDHLIDDTLNKNDDALQTTQNKDDEKELTNGLNDLTNSKIEEVKIDKANDGESTLFDFQEKENNLLPNDLSIVDEPKTTKSDDNVQTIVTEKETIVSKPNSQLYKKKPTNESNLNIIDNSPIEELFKEEIIDLDNHIASIKEEINPQKEEENKDEFSLYDVKVLERVMNDARSEVAKNDKNRMLKLWNILDRDLEEDKVHIAKTLQLGQITAVGNKEFIIIYPNALLCNQVMRKRFKKEALKLLYDIMGDTYNYMALPENIWEDKRNEYRSQYYTGIKYPKLTPINDPNLNILNDDNTFVDEKEEAISKVQKMFGKDLVSIE